nr:galactose-specific lectin nattectin-like [Solea senegalensis]
MMTSHLYLLAFLCLNCEVLLDLREKFGTKGFVAGTETDSELDSLSPKQTEDRRETIAHCLKEILGESPEELEEENEDDDNEGDTDDFDEYVMKICAVYEGPASEESPTPKVQSQAPDCPEKCHRCPAGWTKLGRNCFFFSHQEKSWTQAESVCVSRSGRLASYPDERTLTVLYNMTVRLTGHHMQVWLGGSFSDREGTWMWSDGSEFFVNEWSEHQPDDHHQCLALGTNGRLHAADCSLQQPFFCVRPL